MAKNRTVPLPWTTVWTNIETPSNEFLPATPWMDAASVEKVRGTFELRAKMGSLNVALGYQTAQVEDTPSSHSSFGAFATTNNVSYPTGWTDISGTTSGKQLIRYGWVVKNSSGTTLNLGRVGGVVETQSC